MTLVDSSSWIEYLSERKSEIGDRVETLVLSGDAAWCDMTLVELWHGARGAREKRQLSEMENEIDRLPVDKPVWQFAFRLARRCRENGLTVPPSDIIVAACATHHHLDLEHCDNHFRRILPIAAAL
jgi:predicted nucleic acid-binding protein